MNYDFREFEKWVLDVFEPEMRLGPGRYARSKGEDVSELYGVSDMACTLYTLNRLHPDEKEHAGWREAFHEFQQADTGFIVEKEVSHNDWHNTAFALGAMHLLGIHPRLPLKFMQDYQTREQVVAFMEKIDWVKNSYGGSHVGAGLGSIAALAPDTVNREWFEMYFDYCDSMFDPNNGMMGREKPPEGDMDQVGGTFHYHFIYEHFHREMPHPDARVDSVLGLNVKDGIWTDPSGWWITLDGLYLLTRTARRTLYRIDEIREATKSIVAYWHEAVHDAAFREKAYSHFGVHNMCATTSLLAETQQVLGCDAVITDRPWQQILDRRPFI
jgi:hypothetical protein